MRSICRAGVAVAILSWTLMLPTPRAAVAADGMLRASANPTTADDPDSWPDEKLREWLRVQEELPQFEQYLERTVPGFAWLYRDSSGAITVRAAAEGLGSAHDATRAAPAGVRVNVVEAMATLKELTATYEAITSRLHEGKLAGVAVHTVGIDLINNRIEVGVGTITPEAQAAVSEYGEIWLEETTAPSPASCTGRGNCYSPVMGGLNIRRPTTGTICTAGYVARDASEYFLVTAGHCGSIGTIWEEDGGFDLGAITRRSFTDGSKADAAAISIPASQRSNKIFYGYTTTFKSVTQAGGYLLGDVICMTGRSMSTYDCGTVTAVSETICYENRCFNQQGTAKNVLGAAGGTSGAPVFKLLSSPNVALAAVFTSFVHRETVEIGFSPMFAVQSNLNTLMCVTNSC